MYVCGLFFSVGDRASDRLACQLFHSSVRDKPLRADAHLRAGFQDSSSVAHGFAVCHFERLCRADREQHF